MKALLIGLSLFAGSAFAADCSPTLVGKNTETGEMQWVSSCRNSEYATTYRSRTPGCKEGDITYGSTFTSTDEFPVTVTLVCRGGRYVPANR